MWINDVYDGVLGMMCFMSYDRYDVLMHISDNVNDMDGRSDRCCNNGYVKCVCWRGNAPGLCLP